MGTLFTNVEIEALQARRRFLDLTTRFPPMVPDPAYNEAHGTLTDEEWEMYCRDYNHEDAMHNFKRSKAEYSAMGKLLVMAGLDR